MSMRRTLLYILFLLPYLCFANSVSEDQARHTAEVFLNNLADQHQSTTRAMTYRLQLVDTRYDQLYVFNSESSNSFVVVSASDKTEAVLGYSNECSFSVGNMPSALSYWLEELNNQVKVVGNGWGRASATRSTDHAAITPMVTSKWNQSAPYNLKVATSSNQYVTGCVATAMAQIMYYHKWPEQVTERLPSPGAALIDLEPTTFNWSIMRDTYTKNDTDEGAQEVAKLMAYCGYAAKMNYDMGSSGAYEDNATEGMRRFLGYDKSTELIYRTCYTSKQWDEIIYQELAAKRPVLYCGFAAGGGHAFVCDGYDGNGYYHINWGWGGNSNAYFLLSVLNPDDQGVGGAPGSDGYSIWQSAIIGIQKPETPYETKRLVTTRVFTQTPDIERSSVSEDFSLKVYSYLTNDITPTQSATFDTAFGLYQGESLLAVFEGNSNKTVKSGNFSSTSKTLQFGKGLSDGVYQIRALQRLSGTSEWLYAHMARAVYLQLQIAGTKLTATEVNASILLNEKLLTTMEVLSASVNGSAYAKRAVEIVANVKNTGTQTQGVMNLEIASKSDFSDATLVSMVGVHIDPGQTEDVKIHFTPEKTGTLYVRLVDRVSMTVLKELSVKIESAPAVILKSLGLTVDNIALKSGYPNYYDLTGNTLKASVQVQNLSTGAYEDYLYLYLFSRKPEDESWPSSKTYEIAYAKIEPGETKAVEFRFDNLEVGKEYALGAYYLENGERGKLPDFSSGIYLVVEGAGINKITNDGSPKVIYNLQGRNMGTDPSILPKGIYIIDGKKVVKQH